MDRLALRFVICIIGLLGASQACAGCTPSEPVAMVVDVEPHVTAYTTTWIVAPFVAVAEAPRVDLALPDTCDRLYAVLGENGPRLTKRTPAWLRSPVERAAHQAEIRRGIAIVVGEMGGDALAAEFLYRKAILESSGNPGAVHVLDLDLDANRSSARRGMAMSTERWADARVVVYSPDGDQAGTVNAWTIGRGLYGMNTGLYLHHWSTDSPPWSLCDPVVATVTAIWSLRAGLRRCAADDLRTAYRLISSGQCGERSEAKEANFDRLARGRVRGLRLEPFDVDAKADFGERWDQESSDPAVLLAVIRVRLASEGARP